MTHAYHDALPGYDERQILHDGCPECEHRGKHLDSALAHMDPETFSRAWQRSYDMKASDGDRSAVGHVSDAEVWLLNLLWGIRVHQWRCGILPK